MHSIVQRIKPEDSRARSLTRSGYHACNLTVTSDTLVAVASVAKIIDKQFSDNYMTGM